MSTITKIKKSKTGIIILKEKTGNISFFEITKDNRLIMSGSSWKEKKGPDRLPIYGSCKSGNLGSQKEAKLVLSELIKLLQ